MPGSKQRFRNESKEELENRKNIVKISDDVNDVDKFRARSREGEKHKNLNEPQRIHKVHSLMSGERLELMPRYIVESIFDDFKAPEKA